MNYTVFLQWNTLFLVSLEINFKTMYIEFKNQVIDGYVGPGWCGSED